MQVNTMLSSQLTCKEQEAVQVGRTAPIWAFGIHTHQFKKLLDPSVLILLTHTPCLVYAAASALPAPHVCVAVLVEAAAAPIRYSFG